MSHFYAYLSRMKLIRRWGLMRNTREENIQEHSHQCAVLAHALAVLGNKRLGKDYDPAHVALLALYHESAETITGDLATPIKYFNPEIRDAYKKIEHVAELRLLSMLPSDFQAEYLPLLQPKSDASWALVKAADTLCAYLKCVEERKAGNHEYEKAESAILAKMSEMSCPELHIFLQEFAPSFELTLDELN